MEPFRQRQGWHRRRAVVLGCCITIGCLMPGPEGVAAGPFCGNGTVETGEQCDDGAANGSDGCCSATCQLIDADHDGVCDTLDPCTNVVPVTIETPRVVFANPTDPSGAMVFTVRGSVVVPLVPAIDPPAKGIRLVMRHNFYEVPLDVTVPGGLGWKANANGKGWVYRDANGEHGGVTRVTLRQVGATPGALAFAIEGMRAPFPYLTQTVPLKISLVIDSPVASTGQCGETWLRPSLCRLDSTGLTLRCGSLPRLFTCHGSRPEALVRCDLGQAVAGQEAYWMIHHSYYTGACAGLPGVVPSPGVVCSTAGTYRDFLVTSGHPSARESCGWNTCLVPGGKPLFCSPFPFTQSCGG